MVSIFSCSLLLFSFWPCAFCIKGNSYRWFQFSPLHHFYSFYLEHICNVWSCSSRLWSWGYNSLRDTETVTMVPPTFKLLVIWENKPSLFKPLQWQIFYFSLLRTSSSDIQTIQWFFMAQKFHVGCCREPAWPKNPDNTRKNDYEKQKAMLYGASLQWSKVSFVKILIWMSISVNKHLINACHGSGTVLTMKIWHGSKHSRFDGINKQCSRVKTKYLTSGPWAPYSMAPAPLYFYLLLSSQLASYPGLCAIPVYHAFPHIYGLGCSPPSGSAHESPYPKSHPWTPSVNEPIPPQSPPPYLCPLSSSSHHQTCFWVCFPFVCLPCYSVNPMKTGIFLSFIHCSLLSDLNSAKHN